MAKEKHFSVARQIIIQGIMVNALALALNLVILATYSFLKGVAFSALVCGSLELLLLLEAGILLLAGGAHVVTSGVSFGKIRERVFNSREWSPEELRRSERRALPFVMAGVLILAESLALALV